MFGVCYFIESLNQLNGIEPKSSSGKVKRFPENVNKTITVLSVSEAGIVICVEPKFFNFSLGQIFLDNIIPLLQMVAFSIILKDNKSGYKKDLCSGGEKSGFYVYDQKLKTVNISELSKSSRKNAKDAIRELVKEKLNDCSVLLRSIQ